MKTTQTKYAAEQGIAEEAALKQGMADELYAKAELSNGRAALPRSPNFPC